MRVLIIWIGPWLDKGEAAMLISMKDALQQQIPNISITASASSFSLQDIDMAKYGEYGFKVLPGIYPSIISAVPKFKLIKSKTNSKTIKFTLTIPFILIQAVESIIWLALYRTLRLDLNPLITSTTDIVSEYKDADYIIFCGGQYITKLGRDILIALYEIIFSKTLNKPVMIWANSLGPFDPKYIHPFVRWALNKVDLITTREATSKMHLDRIGVTAPSFVTADAAFILPTVPPEEALLLIKRETEIPENRIMVGVTVIPWKFLGEDNPNKKFDLYLGAVASAVDHIVGTFGAHVFFFPQVIIPNVKDDRPISFKVLDKINNKSAVTVLTEDYSPEQIKGMYGCMSLLIGTRFHSCILAQSMHVPTIAIEYDGHKALGIMRLLELENYVCHINTITSHELISKVDEIWKDRDNVKQKLEKNIPVMQAESMKNLSLAVQYLDLKEM